MSEFDPNDISEPEYALLDSIFEARMAGGYPPMYPPDKMEYAKFFHIAFGEDEVDVWRRSIIDLCFVGETMTMMRDVADEKFQQDEGYLWFYRMAYDIRYARELGIEFMFSADRVYTLLLSPLAAVGTRTSEDALRELYTAVNSLGYHSVRRMLLERIPLDVIVSAQSAGMDASLIDALVDGA